MATPSAAPGNAAKSARDIYLRRLKSDVDAACEALGSAEVLEVLEGLRVLKAASLDASCREFIIRSGGFSAVITCFIGTKPSPNNWLLLEVLETAATTLQEPEHSWENT